MKARAFKVIPLFFCSVLMSLGCFQKVFASEWLLCPYLALDAQLRYMPYKPGFGKEVLKSEYPQGNISAGLRLHTYFGIEGGYEVSATRTRTATVGSGDMVLGRPANGVLRYTSKAQLKGWHGGLVGFYPISECFQLEGYAGAIRLRAYHQTTVVAQNGAGVNTLMNTDTFAKNRTVWKLAAGFRQRCYEEIGIRFLIGWENSSRLGYISSPETGRLIKPKDSLLVSFGVVGFFF